MQTVSIREVVAAVASIEIVYPHHLAAGECNLPKGHRVAVVDRGPVGKAQMMEQMD